MATFGFRLRFQVPFGYSFRGVHPTRRIRLPGITGRVYLRKLGRPRRFRFTHRPEYAFFGSQFLSHADAQQCASRLKRALLLFAAQSRIGFEAGKDQATASMTAAARRAVAASSGSPARNDVLGIDVFADQPPPRWIRISGTGTVTRDIANYELTLTSFYTEDFTWTPKQQLALELYNLSHFDEAPKVRFLALVTVVEVLAQRPKSSSAIRTFITEQLLRRIKSAATLSDDEKRLLSEGVGGLKRESIGRACKQLIAAYGTAADVEYFATCYRTRSELVHDGFTAEAVDPTRLDELVSRVLVGHLTNGADSKH